MRANLLFLSGEHIANYLSQIFILIYVAAAIGPESFGVLSFALLIQNSIHLLSALNLQRFLIKDLLDRPLHLIFSSILSLRLFALIIVSTLALVWLHSTTRPDDQNLIYTAFAISTIFLSYDLFVGYFRYHNDFKISFKINSVLTFTFIIFKALAVMFGSLKVLLFVFIFEYFLKFSVHLFVFLSRTSFKYSLKYVSKKYIKQLFYAGCFITAGSIFFVFIRRVPPFYLEANNLAVELGYYLFALRISELSTSIIAIFSDAFFPTMSKNYRKNSSKYRNQYVELTSIVFWMAIFIFVIAIIFVEPLLVLFGLESYLDSTKYLYTLLFASIFSSWAFLRASHLTLLQKTASQMKITMFSFIATLISLSLFISTNNINMIAYSVIVGTFSSALFFPLFFKETREVVFLQVRALNPFYSYRFLSRK